MENGIIIYLVSKLNLFQNIYFQGYFRRAEVEAASGLYDEAIISYTHALQLDPQNQKLIDSIKELSEMQEN
ncbi:tetratricopeptide repeat protein, partial [Pseudomonas aeruginosa]